MLTMVSRRLPTLNCRFISVPRFYSSNEDSPKSGRKKSKGASGDQKHLPLKPSVAPSTSQLLEDFLAQVTTIKNETDEVETEKTEASKPAQASGVRSHRKRDKRQADEGPDPTPEPTIDKDIIKSVDLLRDFLSRKGQPLQRLSQISQAARKATRIRHIEPLPEPAALHLFDEKNFQEPDEDESAYRNEVYNEVLALEASAYRAKSTHNRFEELIQWTLDGKLWKYPIDNEQDWTEELNTPFHEHVFLSRFMNKKTAGKNPAPLKSFMELVCAGLGQNPYFSVEQKREHLRWFEGYFADKIKDIEAAVEEEKRISQAQAKSQSTKA